MCQPSVRAKRKNSRFFFKKKKEPNKTKQLNKKTVWHVQHFQQGITRSAWVGSSIDRHRSWQRQGELNEIRIAIAYCKQITGGLKEINTDRNEGKKVPPSPSPSPEFWASVVSWRRMIPRHTHHTYIVRHLPARTGPGGGRERESIGGKRHHPSAFRVMRRLRRRSGRSSPWAAHLSCAWR